MIDIRPGMTYGETLAAKRQEREERKAQKEAWLKSPAVKTIFAVLNTMFVDLDAKMVANQKEWAKGRVAAIKEYKDAQHALPRSERDNSHKYYEKVFNLAGGKTWYGIFNGRNEEMINEFIEKNCKATAEARNVSIAKKLIGVTEVLSTEVHRSNDGFHGTFTVVTDKGNKTVRIETIYAGGYNIQCFHQRTLVKVK